MEELEDRLEALNAEIDYKEEAISELQKSLTLKRDNEEMIDALLESDECIDGLTKEESQVMSLLARLSAIGPKTETAGRLR